LYLERVIYIPEHFDYHKLSLFEPDTY